MKRALFFTLIAALLLIPYGVTYAYDGANAADNYLSIEPADPALAPNINVIGNAIGGVSAGDLFYIDITNTMADTPFTLYITNVDELVHSYRYMNLNIGLYVQTSADSWEKVTATAGELLQDMYITMQNGMASFTLLGNAKYKITIEKGCFYSYGISPGKSIAIPSFYLSAS
ncbi:MAG: hypothetical protein A2Z15_01950 [Chloroflexi bacterium RBG_16_50_11]|nr:MAG: hypothetical protein A2Z15_01950 [Chloroflexi bacterium RBG_16_50_11]